MRIYLYIATLVFLASCGQTNNNTDKNEVVNTDSVSKAVENTSVRKFQLTDKTVKFLWRADKYDETLKDTFNSIFIDEDFCKTIIDPERAALGYVATFIGNECNWDGDYKDDRSNLKCKILTALNLGYQCSDKHLGFLRQMFKNDTKVLEELKAENCPTTPDGATIQDTFTEITLTVKGNEILVIFKASGVNLREGDTWSWTETDRFQLDNDNIKLIKKDESKVKHEHFEMGE
jgi:hypothetical protein